MQSQIAFFSWKIAVTSVFTRWMKNAHKYKRNQRELENNRKRSEIDHRLTELRFRGSPVLLSCEEEGDNEEISADVLILLSG